MKFAAVFLLDEDQSTLEPERGYDREVVERVWQFARTVAGNDPSVWRKDEHGAWIHRLAYRNRHSEFGRVNAQSAISQPNSE